MTHPGESRSTRWLTVTWIALLALSIINYSVAEAQLAGSSLAIAVLAAAFVKLGLITAVFMELWHRGRGWLLVALAIFGLTLGLVALAW